MLPWYLWIHFIYGLGHVVTVVPAMSMGAWSWAAQARGILENVVTSLSFRWDPNHWLKVDRQLRFLYDEAGGRWWPFAATALLAQAALALMVWRLVRQERS